MRYVVCLLGLTFFASLSPGAPASGPDPAVVALSAEIETETVLLRDDLERFSRTGRRRDEALSRLTELYRALDASLAAEDEGAAARVERLVEQLSAAEGERRALADAERGLVERLQDRRRRIRLLEQHAAALEQRREEPGGPLTGTWDVKLLPSDQGGKFHLEQSGTLVTGTYWLEGDQTGSLQGTLVKRKVYFVRIDSRLGRSMELEGYLSGDGQQIRGNWLSYELAEGEGATGQWSARKRPSGN